MMNDVERAVERLTSDHTVLVDGHMTEWQPLLSYLESSVTELVGRNGGGGGSVGNGIPINEDALLLLDHVRKRLTMMCAALYLPMVGDMLADTRMVWSKAQDEYQGGRMDAAQWDMFYAEFPDWVARIEAEDDRPRKMEMTTPCPRCDTRWVYVVGRDEYANEPATSGDPRKAAITVEWNIGRAPVAECRNPECGTMWAGWSAISTLGYTVGAAQDHAILEACGISLDLTGR